MSALGSVFLGDLQRHGVSPPVMPVSSSRLDGGGGGDDEDEDVLESLDSPAKTVISATADKAPAAIDPVLSLQLRLRWLEALLLGVRQEPRDRKRERPSELKPGESLVQLAADVQHRLNTVVESNDGLKKFMHQYDQHAQLLAPASSTLQGAPTYENMSADELDALLVEMEPDVRTADRDMREIELLEQKGVLSAGKLADYEALLPRLQTLFAAQEQDIQTAALLEKRIAALVQRHATHVDTLSELFVAWDDVVTESESKIKVLERDKEERRRLGYAI